MLQVTDSEWTILADSQVGMDCFRGKVVNVGDGEYDGRVIKSPVVEGDIVWFAHHSGDKLADNLLTLPFRNILAVETVD